VKFWEPYLKGTSFVVKTDCISLCRLDVIFSKNNPTLRRKIQSLADYSFRIEHISGASNSISDFWSRYPFKKKFCDKATQYDLTPCRKMVAKVDQKDSSLEKAITKVSSLCALQNRNKESSSQSVKGEISAEGDQQLQNSCITTPLSKHERQELPKVQIVPPRKTTVGTEPVERLIPAGFFSKRKHKDCKVSTVQLKDTGNTSECCLMCDNEKGKVDTCIKTVDHHVTTDSISTELNDNAVGEPEIQIKLKPTISSLSAIRAAQASDSILSMVKDWLLTGAKPVNIQAFRAPKELVSYWKQFSLLSLKDGIIMRKWIAVDKEEERLLICVPESNQEAVLKMCHTSLVANHPGIKLTLDICRRYYYWPGMSQDVELYVKACITCARVKQPQAYSKAKRQHIIAREFNQILVIDHIECEKLGITGAGNKYILSMTDVWSGYVVAAATNSQRAVENISIIMHKWALIHGFPREIICDNAPGFRAAFYQAVLKSMNCKYTYGLPYECKSSSKAERTNKRLNQSLRLVLEGKDPTTWDKYLDYTCSALNSLKNRNTGYIANFLLYGLELNTPITLLLEW
jgi:hypothetical protein